MPGKGDRADKAPKTDKRDLRRRFTGQGRVPRPDDPDAAEYERLAAELADSVGRTVRVATELGLVVAETFGLKLMEVMSPTRPVPGRRAAGSAAASVFSTAKEKLPEFNAQTASKITDLVVGRGFAALRAVQQTVSKTRRQG